MKLKETIDFVNGILPSKGSVLLSEPFLQDPHFERSVVLMCEHSDAESFGFVLNHSANVQLHELIDIAPTSIPVFIGGPVAENGLFYLHTQGKLKMPSAAQRIAQFGRTIKTIRKM